MTTEEMNRIEDFCLLGSLCVHALRAKEEEPKRGFGYALPELSKPRPVEFGPYGTIRLDVTR